jgi:hypothetical protein
MHAFVRQRHGAGASETLAGCAHDGAAAFDPKIHCFTPVLSDDLKFDIAIVANPDLPDKRPRTLGNAWPPDGLCTNVAGNSIALIPEVCAGENELYQ